MRGKNEGQGPLLGQDCPLMDTYGINFTVLRCEDLKPEHPSSQCGIAVIQQGVQMPVDMLSSPHNCQHLRCFVVSFNYRKPQTYRSAGLIVSPRLTVSVYANIDLL